MHAYASERTWSTTERTARCWAEMPTAMPRVAATGFDEEWTSSKREFKSKTTTETIPIRTPPQHKPPAVGGKKRQRPRRAQRCRQQNNMARPDPSATMNLRCPVALDEMVKAKARQDEEDLKGPSGLARMMKTFQDETTAAAASEAVSAATKRTPRRIVDPASPRGGKAPTIAACRLLLSAGTIVAPTSIRRRIP